jgi:hypothetical protein
MELEQAVTAYLGVASSMSKYGDRSVRAGYVAVKFREKSSLVGSRARNVDMCLVVDGPGRMGAHCAMMTYSGRTNTG